MSKESQQPIVKREYLTPSREGTIFTCKDTLADLPPLEYGVIKPYEMIEFKDRLGNTPLVCLDEQDGLRLMAKIEGTNPCGSVKARTAYALLQEAISSGKINPAKGIVIGSGGNFAIALASLCNTEQIPLTVALLASAPKPFSREITALGAKVVNDAQTRDERRSITDEFMKKGYYFADQHNSPTAFYTMATTLGPELLTQTQGRLTDVVAGFGTGMTALGVGMYLKKRFAEGVTQNPVTITAVEDDLSVLDFHIESLPYANATREERDKFLAGYQERTKRPMRVYRTRSGDVSKVVFDVADRAVDDIPGIGISGLQPAVQELLPMKLLSRVEKVIPADAYTATRALQQRGLNIGISSGAAYIAAQRIFSQRLEQGARGDVVAVFPDVGNLYQDLLRET